MKKQSIFKIIQSYFFITLGLLINAFAWAGFLIPAKILGGGITGLSTIFYYMTGFQVGFSVLIVNSVLIILAIKILGPKYGISSIYGIVVLSTFLIVLQKVITHPIITDRFMSAIIGGGLGSFGIAIAFMNGGNSGGTDIIALIVTKYKNISPGKVIMYIDIFIIATSYFIAHSWETVVYSYVVMGVFALVLDYVLDGAKQSYQITIMSRKSHEIAERITQEVGRGVTLIKGTGWYTKQDVDVLIVIIHKTDKPIIYRILHDYDIHAFISEAKVSAVFGQNFGKVKV